MKVLITGANGFIGKNLQLHLNERSDVNVVCFTRKDDVSKLPSLLEDTSFIFHLAGVNRSQNSTEFYTDNVELTSILCAAIIRIGRKIPIIYTSSIQTIQNNLYGTSKREAEDALFNLSSVHDVPVSVFRLPNVFGKWSEPNYNSVVATFCHNIANAIPIQITSPDHLLKLVYIDDVIERFIQLMDGADTTKDSNGFEILTPQYTITVRELADFIHMFKESRKSLLIESVGHGLIRALYSTYMSYLSPKSFVYKIPKYMDSRGVFVEMLKTRDYGQFSYFSALPGVTRGGHYHHTKTEKFLVVKGRALFKFRHILTGETYEVVTTAEKTEVVETVPGWTHDITNIGTDEMLVMLWANELFNRSKPDTYFCPL